MAGVHRVRNKNRLKINQRRLCDLLDCNLKGKDLKVLQFKVDKLDRASLYKVSAVRGDVVKLPIISKNTNRKSGIVTVLVDDSVSR